MLEQQARHGALSNGPVHCVCGNANPPQCGLPFLLRPLFPLAPTFSPTCPHTPPPSLRCTPSLTVPSPLLFHCARCSSPDVPPPAQAPAVSCCASSSLARYPPPRRALRAAAKGPLICGVSCLTSSATGRPGLVCWGNRRTGQARRTVSPSPFSGASFCLLAHSHSIPPCASAEGAVGAFHRLLSVSLRARGRGQGRGAVGAIAAPFWNPNFPLEWAEPTSLRFSEQQRARISQVFFGGRSPRTPGASLASPLLRGHTLFHS